MFGIVRRTVVVSVGAKPAGSPSSISSVFKMNCFPIVSELLIALLAFVNVSAQPPGHPGQHPQAVTIPLDQIWAWRMPGTKNVGTLDAVKIGGTTTHPILHDIFGGLGLLPKGERAGTAFVVDGVGKTALMNARAAFKKEKKRAEVVPANTDLSLVFYSHSSARWVHLVSVEKTERLITIKYRFVIC